MLLGEYFKQMKADGMDPYTTVSVKTKKHGEIHRGSIESCTDVLLNKVIVSTDYIKKLCMFNIVVK